MQEKLNKLRQQIKVLKERENKLVLELIKQKAYVNDTYKIPGVEKSTWKKLEGQLHRSTIYRRKLKQIK